MVNLLSSASSQKGRGPADREDGRLMSLNNHLIEVWMPVFLLFFFFCRSEIGGGGVEMSKQSKKAINLVSMS